MSRMMCVENLDDIPEQNPYKNIKIKIKQKEIPILIELTNYMAFIDGLGSKEREELGLTPPRKRDGWIRIEPSVCCDAFKSDCSRCGLREMCKETGHVHLGFVKRRDMKKYRERFYNLYMKILNS